MPDFDSRGTLPSSGRGDFSEFTARGVGQANPPAPPADVTAPVVTLVSPLDGQVEPTTAVVFDVTEESTAGLCDVFVYAVFAASGDVEVIHDGDAFTARYLGQSARPAITGGFRYTVRRTGGWPSNPRIRVKAIDRAGNVSS